MTHPQHQRPESGSESGPEPELKKAAPGCVYGSSKTYTFNTGFTTCFRQWRAESHCRFLHGYALQFHVEFRSKELDARNWVVDFGSLKSFKGWLENMFDHTTLVAEDDPQISIFRELHVAGLIDMRTVHATGCEAIARMVFEYLSTWLVDNGYSNVELYSVEVKEHDGNGATYSRG